MRFLRKPVLQLRLWLSVLLLSLVLHLMKVMLVLHTRMLSVFQQLRNAGYTVLDAVKEGSLQRLRTVLMTAMLAALGLLPMALSHDIGSETQRPLAIVVIGGLFTATLLTLVVLPALYVSWFSNTRLAPAHRD